MLATAVGPAKGTEFMRSLRSLQFIVGGLLLAGVATAAVLRWFDNPPPARIREEAVERVEPPGPVETLTPDRAKSIQKGMTAATVESLFGPGSPATLEMFSPLTLDGDQRERWEPKQAAGHVAAWRKPDKLLLVAYTATPDTGGTVVGALGRFDHGATIEFIRVPPTGPFFAPEPRRIYGRTRDDPVVVANTNELVDRAPDLKGKWVRVSGMVDEVVEVGGKTIGLLHMVSSRPQVVQFHFQGGAWKNAPVAVNDTILVSGKLENTNKSFTTLTAVELASRDPAKPEPPIEITAMELTKAFAADPVAAHEKYKTKYLKVTGEVRLKGAKSAPGGMLGLDGVKDPKSSFNMRVVGAFEADQKDATDAVQPFSTITFVGRLGNRWRVSRNDILLSYCRIVK